MDNFKIVVFGDVGVGKSSMTIQLVENRFVENYDPTIEDSWRNVFSVDGEETLLEILDTSFLSEQTRCMIHMYIANGDGFIMTYSITHRKSFDELATIYNKVETIRNQMEKPFTMLLVGNKIDLEKERQVSTEEGQELATLYNCPFIETSAKDRINIEEAYSIIVRNMKELKKKRQIQVRRK